MAFVVDLVIAALFLFSVFLGYKRGFVKTVFSCLTLVAALVAAYMFGDDVGIFLKTTPAYETVEEMVEEELSEQFDEIYKDGIADAEEMGEKLLASPMAEKLTGFGISAGKLEIMYKSALKTGVKNAKKELVEKVTLPIMEFIVNAVGMVAVFVVSLIVLKLLSFVLDRVVRLPVLNSINKVGGVFAGIAIGVLWSFLLCTALGLLLPYIPENPVAYIGMEKDTVLYSFFIGINPLILLLFA